MANGKRLITAEEAARIGAEAALEKIAERERKDREKRERERMELPDRRKNNVKLLLRNFRALRDHAENAVYEMDLAETPFEILEDLMQGRDTAVKVESIMKSAARTAVMVEHMTAMLELFDTYCVRKGSPEWLRRRDVIHELFISDGEVTIRDLADKHCTVIQSIYNDIDVACERIAALMFGIDGLKTKRERKKTGENAGGQ